MDAWTPYAREYNPVTVGSIDGTDTEAHDHGIIRALQATYRPNKRVTGDPACTVFVARLNHVTTEDALRRIYAPFGALEAVRVVRDVVTGFSKGYAFVEFCDAGDAAAAVRETHQTVVDDKEVLVEREWERTMPGWVPRRMGGGFGGMKESGQLRFGGLDRPFRKPIAMEGTTAGGGGVKEQQEGGAYKQFSGDGDRKPGGFRSRYDRKDAYPRERSYERSYDKGRQRDGRRSRSRERERYRDRGKDRGDTLRDRDTDRDRGRNRYADKERDTDKDRYTDRDRRRDRDRDKRR